MNQARNVQRVSGSNPHSVLESIQAATGIANQLVQPSPTDSPGPNHAGVPGSDSTPDLISLRINPETTRSVDERTSDLIENHVESAKQIQQLANRLKQNEQDLQRRSAELEQKIQTWNQTVAEQETLYQSRDAQLQQQASHVRCQQLHLMQLQTDIVKSYEAARLALETLFTEPTNQQSSLAALKALKYEVSGRFNFIARRWEHLAKRMQGIRDEQAIHNAHDDSVDWTSEVEEPVK